MTRLPIRFPSASKSDEKAIRDVEQIADHALATTTDLGELRFLADELKGVRDSVAAATRDRDKINRIAVKLLRTQRAAGQELTRMREAGERHPRGGDQAKLRGATSIPTLSDLGFVRSRAWRWQLAGMLPSDLYEQYERETLESDDGIVVLAGAVRAAKLWLGQAKQRVDVVPTEASIELADCLDWLPRQDACDALLTDPPYSTEIEDITTFAQMWIPTALAKVKPTGRAYVCIGAYAREIAAYHAVKPPRHLRLAQMLVWTYRNRVGPSPTHDYKLNWEAVLYYCGRDAPPLGCSRAVNDYPDLNEQFSVKEISLPEPRRGESWHGWQKPDELCEQFVRHATQPGDLVLDPFAGTGSFILAAARLGRLGRGCDNDPQMVKIAVERGCDGGAP